MARPREFDADEAIVKAMNVFWGMGYENAALPDLLSGMGLTRGSLYKAFKGKKPLFLTVLKKYEEIAVLPAVEMLEDRKQPNGLDRIEGIYRVITGAVRTGDDRGCLMCMTAAGIGEDDSEITDAVHELFEKMRAGFQTALLESQGSPMLQEQSHAMSNALLAQYVGLRTMARSQVRADVLDQSIDALMAQLRRR
jgi:TetR/AcrR family transcriptional repressor of nem operon